MLKSTRLATDTYRRGPKPTGVAVVGVDHPGRRILRVLRENFQAEVLWLCDPDQERLENLERRCPGARVATRIDGVVGDPAVEAVFVGGPAEAKCGLITQVLEAGKHVFIHTPQEWGSEPPDEIADTASAHGRILRCGTPLLHSPPVHAIKQVVSSGEMGELDFVSSSRVGTDVAPPELDVIADLGPRELFVVLYWLAELPVTVRAASRAVVQPGVADIACITLTFASGLLVNLELSRVGPPALSRTVLVGRRRMAIYDESADQQVRLFDRGGVRTAPRGDEDGEDVTAAAPVRGACSSGCERSWPHRPSWATPWGSRSTPSSRPSVTGSRPSPAARWRATSCASPRRPGCRSATAVATSRLPARPGRSAPAVPGGAARGPLNSHRPPDPSTAAMAPVSRTMSRPTESTACATKPWPSTADTPPTRHVRSPFPIYQTVAHDFVDADHAGAIMDLETPGFHYNRINNPTVDVLERRMAALEDGTAAMAVSSGSAAVSMSVLNIVGAGDNFVSVPQLYGATYTYFAHVLPRLGVEVRFARDDQPESIAELIDDRTKAIFCETVGNPAGNVIDLEAVAEVAHAQGVPIIADNTVATPFLLKPLRHGADVVVHSLTKFVGGHGTTLGGIDHRWGHVPVGRAPRPLPVALRA